MRAGHPPSVIRRNEMGFDIMSQAIQTGPIATTQQREREYAVGAPACRRLARRVARGAARDAGSLEGKKRLGQDTLLNLIGGRTSQRGRP